MVSLTGLWDWHVGNQVLCVLYCPVVLQHVTDKNTSSSCLAYCKTHPTASKQDGYVPQGHAHATVLSTRPLLVGPLSAQDPSWVGCGGA